MVIFALINDFNLSPQSFLRRYFWMFFVALLSSMTELNVFRVHRCQMRQYTMSIRTHNQSREIHHKEFPRRQKRAFIKRFGNTYNLVFRSELRISPFGIYHKRLCPHVYWDQRAIFTFLSWTLLSSAPSRWWSFRLQIYETCRPFRRKDTRETTAYTLHPVRLCCFCENEVK